MSLDNKDEQVKGVLIPKGTRGKIQGCPFYLAEDTKIQEQDEDSRRVLSGVLAEEKADMESWKARREARLTDNDSKTIKSIF